MTLVVQDSTGLVSGANAYAGLAAVRAYWAARGTDLSAPDTSDAALEAAIIQATDYVDRRYRFVGVRLQRPDVQSTQWPRRDAFDADGYEVWGIPTAVQQAVAELAHRALTATLMDDPTRDTSGRPVASRSESVGPISESVTYAGGGMSWVPPEYPAADQLLHAAGLTVQGMRLARA